MKTYFFAMNSNGEGEFELFYNDRESITNDSSIGMLIVIPVAHEIFCIWKMEIFISNMLEGGVL